MNRLIVRNLSAPRVLSRLRLSSLPTNRSTGWFLALVLPLAVGPVWHLACRVIPSVAILGSATGLVLLSLLLTSAYTDLTAGKIYNWATYPAFLWAVAINGLGALGHFSGWRPFIADALGSRVLPLGDIGLAACLLGGLTCFGAMTVVHVTSGGGAGDVKLATAIGALLGVERGFLALVDSYLIAATAIVAYLIWRVGPLSLAIGVGRKLGSVFLPGWVSPPTADQDQLFLSPVRLGLFFAIGTMASLFGIVPC